MCAFTAVSRWEQGLSSIDEQVYAEAAAGADRFVVVVNGARFPAPLGEVLPEVCRYLGGFGLTVTGVHVQAATTACVYVQPPPGAGTHHARPGAGEPARRR